MAADVARKRKDSTGGKNSSAVIQCVALLLHLSGYFIITDGECRPYVCKGGATD
jgi:hypothetical protein